MQKCTQKKDRHNWKEKWNYSSRIKTNKIVKDTYDHLDTSTLINGNILEYLEWRRVMQLRLK